MAASRERLDTATATSCHGIGCVISMFIWSWGQNMSSIYASNWHAQQYPPPPFMCNRCAKEQCKNISCACSNHAGDPYDTIIEYTKYNSIIYIYMYIMYLAI